MDGVTIRLSTADDARHAEALRRLALLGDGPAPQGPLALAELAGEPVAAVGPADGSTIAERSRAEAALLAVLQLHRLEVRLIGAIWGY